MNSLVVTLMQILITGMLAINTIHASVPKCRKKRVKSTIKISLSRDVSTLF
ncbi:MAG: hypothetical protein ACJAT7_003526 [Psychromonas sp.]|jgi:hypothetical protein